MIPPTAWAPIAQAAGQAVSALAAAEATPVTSSAQTDARSWMDGSGWTVSTGGGRATGGRMGGNTTDGGQSSGRAAQSTPPPGYYTQAMDYPQPAQAGINPLVGLAIVGAAFFLAKL